MNLNKLREMPLYASQKFAQVEAKQQCEDIPYTTKPKNKHDN